MRPLWVSPVRVWYSQLATCAVGLIDGLDSVPPSKYVNVEQRKHCVLFKGLFDQRRSLLVLTASQIACDGVKCISKAACFSPT